METMKKNTLRILLIIPMIIAVNGFAMNVDSTECPSGWSEYNPQGCTAIGQCTRTDSPAVLTATGNLTTITGDSFDCANCAGCPENPDPPAVCTGACTVSYTEVHSYSVDPGIKFDVKAVEVSLGGKIGWGSQTQYSWTLTCGTTQWPACYQASPAYGIQMKALEERSASLTSTYTWVVSHSGTCSGTSTYAAGSRVSTATGSVKSANGKCESLAAKTKC